MARDLMLIRSPGRGSGQGSPAWKVTRTEEWSGTSSLEGPRTAEWPGTQCLEGPPDGKVARGLAPILGAPRRKNSRDLRIQQKY